MRILFALVVAPLLALADQSAAYAMVGWSCSNESMLPVHLVHFAFLAATIAAAIFASAAWRGTMRADALARKRFLAGVATAAATLSAVTIAAMWMAAWMISPCIA